MNTVAEEREDVQAESVSDLEELSQAEEALLTHTRELIDDSQMPLTFSYPCEFVERRVSNEWSAMDWDEYHAKDQRSERDRREKDAVKRMDGPERRGILKESGAQIATGILWITGPFAVDFWSGRRKKPKPTKCVCACCGHKHNLKVKS